MVLSVSLVGGALRILHQRRIFIIVAIRGGERQKSLAADPLRVKAMTFVCRIEPAPFRGPTDEWVIPVT